MAAFRTWLRIPILAGLNYREFDYMHIYYLAVSTTGLIITFIIELSQRQGAVIIFTIQLSQLLESDDYINYLTVLTTGSGD